MWLMSTDLNYRTHATHGGQSRLKKQQKKFLQSALIR